MKGYGIKLNNVNFFSADLVAKRMNIKIPEEIKQELEGVKWMYLFEYHELNLKTIFDVLIAETEILRCFIETEQFNETAFLYLPPSYPWDVGKNWLNLSKGDIHDEIFFVLKPLLKPEIQKDDIFSLCGEYI